MNYIQLVPMHEKETLKKHLQDYLLHLSKYDKTIEFDKNNVAIYDWFDDYFQDKNRFAIYFKTEEATVGFALVREISYQRYEVAEFCVFEEHRKKGLAMFFAKQIFDLFPGEMELSCTVQNLPAANFWTKFANTFKIKQVKNTGLRWEWIVGQNTFSNHYLNLKGVYFNLIKKGEKTLEGRLFDEKRKKIKVGDLITFTNQTTGYEKLTAIVVDIFNFANFDEMAKNANAKDLGFAKTTKQKMIDTYRSIYKKEDEEKHGVVLFKIIVLPEY